jgi:hypothetical protein
MNRTEIGSFFVMSTKSSTSESFKPLMTTTLIFTEAKEDDKATCKVLSTASWPIRRVMSSNLKGSNVSKLKRYNEINLDCVVDICYLRLRCVRPLSMSSGKRRCKAMPLVVIPIDLSPYDLS